MSANLQAAEEPAKDNWYRYGPLFVAVLSYNLSYFFLNWLSVMKRSDSTFIAGLFTVLLLYPLFFRHRVNTWSKDGRRWDMKSYSGVVLGVVALLSLLRITIYYFSPK